MAGLTIAAAGVDDPHLERDRYDTIAGRPSPIANLTLGVTHAPYTRVLDRFAADGYQLILAGHTHGGQICLPGSVPITLSSNLPRTYGAGAWVYEGMAGYTSVGCGASVVAVRLNCPPEITLHELRRP